MAAWSLVTATCIIILHTYTQCLWIHSFHHLFLVLRHRCATLPHKIWFKAFYLYVHGTHAYVHTVRYVFQNKY